LKCERRKKCGQKNSAATDINPATIKIFTDDYRSNIKTQIAGNQAMSGSDKSLDFGTLESLRWLFG